MENKEEIIKLTNKLNKKYAIDDNLFTTFYPIAVSESKKASCSCYNEKCDRKAVIKEYIKFYQGGFKYQIFTSHLCLKCAKRKLKQKVINSGGV